MFPICLSMKQFETVANGMQSEHTKEFFGVQLFHIRIDRRFYLHFLLHRIQTETWRALEPVEKPFLLLGLGYGRSELKIEPSIHTTAKIYGHTRNVQYAMDRRFYHEFWGTINDYEPCIAWDNIDEVIHDLVLIITCRNRRYVFLSLAHCSDVLWKLIFHCGMNKHTYLLFRHTIVKTG